MNLITTDEKDLIFESKINISLFSDENTKTHFLIYPTLNLESSVRYKQGLYRYVNSFIGDRYRKTYIANNNIFCLYKLPRILTKSDKVFMDEMRLNENYLLSYYVGVAKDDAENELWMCMFSFPTEFENDIKIIMNSQYSKTSNTYKKFMLNFYMRHNKNNFDFINGVLNKTDSFKNKIEKILNSTIDKEAELYDKFEVGTEKYRN